MQRGQTHSLLWGNNLPLPLEVPSWASPWPLFFIWATIEGARTGLGIFIVRWECGGLTMQQAASSLLPWYKDVEFHSHPDSKSPRVI